MTYTSGVKPLFPVSVIRGMITSPWLGKQVGPRLSDSGGRVERVPRNKPGSGFDFADGDDKLGIFRGGASSFANLKPSKPNYQGPVEVTVQDADVCVALTSGPLLPPNTETAYAPGTSSKALHPYIPPLSRSPREPMRNNEPRNPKPGTAMLSKPKTPLRTRFKPLLLEKSGYLGTRATAK